MIITVKAITGARKAQVIEEDSASKEPVDSNKKNREFTRGHFKKPANAMGTNRDFSRGYFYKVKVRSKPEKDKANAEIIELLAKHFNVSKNKVEIRMGKTSREKMIEIKI